MKEKSNNGPFILGVIFLSVLCGISYTFSNPGMLQAFKDMSLTPAADYDPSLGGDPAYTDYGQSPVEKVTQVAPGFASVDDALAAFEVGQRATETVLSQFSINQMVEQARAAGMEVPEKYVNSIGFIHAIDTTEHPRNELGTGYYLGMTPDGYRLLYTEDHICLNPDTGEPVNALHFLIPRKDVVASGEDLIENGITIADFGVGIWGRGCIVAFKEPLKTHYNNPIPLIAPENAFDPSIFAFDWQPTVGDRLFSIGFPGTPPNGDEAAFADMSFITGFDGSYITTDSRQGAGASGVPALNQEGKIVASNDRVATDMDGNGAHLGGVDWYRLWDENGMWAAIEDAKRSYYVKSR